MNKFQRALITVVLIIFFLILSALLAPARADELTRVTNSLAVAQAADCLTTKAIVNDGGYERNPFARGLGLQRSVPGCLLFDAMVNTALRRYDKTKGSWLSKSVLSVETFAVGNNINVMVKYGYRF